MIKLTDDYNSSVLVNENSIIAIIPTINQYGDRRTCVRLLDGSELIVNETPEEILAMPDIETTEKVIDWEQRRYEIAKDIMAASCIRPGVLCISQVTDIADALITELKKGQNND